VWQSLGVSLFIGLQGRALKRIDSEEIYNFDAVKVISILLLAKTCSNRTCAKSHVFFCLEFAAELQGEKRASEALLVRKLVIHQAKKIFL